MQLQVIVVAMVCICLTYAQQFDANVAAHIEGEDDIQLDKAKRRQEILQNLMQSDMVAAKYAQKIAGSPEHNSAGPAIFAVGAYENLGMSSVYRFAGTARQAGFTGDLVLGVLPNSKKEFLLALHSLHTIPYSMKLTCTGKISSRLCSFEGRARVDLPLSILRFYFYQYWALKYDPSARILLVDFHDVFFQTNPFDYRLDPMFGRTHDLMFFEDAYPNKVIYRDPMCKGWISRCYAKGALEAVSTKTVVNAGTTMGLRDSILIYVSLMVDQLSSKVRYSVYEPVVEHDAEFLSVCTKALGVDAAFHNYLIHTGVVSEAIDYKVYQQGEGAVNTLGGYTGRHVTIKKTLKEWNVLHGEGKNKFVVNWNGDVSPVVHQANR
jgi:hypothetical protein